MTKLFDQTSINTMTLANRFVRSATWEGLADKDGGVTPKLADMMAELAKGEVGLIISSHAYVSSEGQAGPGQLGVYIDDLLPGYLGMVNAVHSNNGKIALQLAHAGARAAAALTGLQPVGPSPLDQDGQPLCRKAEAKDIKEITAAFARAAARARVAGFDAVQIHAAHGYLLSQFLSPAFNKRKDKYGGSLENRARFLLEVVAAVRDTVGPAYPVLVKLNSEDFLDDGLTIEEAVAVAAMLEKASIDCVELSGGTIGLPKSRMPALLGDPKTPDREVYYRKAAELYKSKVKIPLMLVGGIRSFEVADELVEQELTDYISLSRPLIREPGLVKRWREGDRRRATCLSDNACYGPAREGRGILCVVEERERMRLAKLKPL